MRFLVLLASFLILCSSSVDGYVALDPNGNLTIQWDVVREMGDGTKHVLIVNNKLFRHLEFPGWKLSWTWPDNKFIKSMQGGEATEQWDCSEFKGEDLPHCCEKSPSIIDLLPGSPYNIQSANCCKGGVVSSVIQYSVNSVSGFEIQGGTTGDTPPNMPMNFSIGVAGYRCSNQIKVPPTKYLRNQGR